MSKWTTEWPKKKKGLYWFYGWRYGRQYGLKGEPIAPELSLVEARKISNGMMYVVRGAFWGPSEGGIGLFCKADLPVLPDVKHLIKEPKK
jgi:hypothetical protein